MFFSMLGQWTLVPHPYASKRDKGIHLNGLLKEYLLLYKFFFNHENISCDKMLESTQLI